MRRLDKSKKQTVILFNYYFESGKSECCLSQDFISNSEDEDEIMEELNLFYENFNRFIEKSLYEVIYTIECKFVSFFDNSKLESFYETFYENLNHKFEGLLEIECSHEVLLNLNETQRETYEYNKEQNQIFGELLSKLPSFN